MYENNENLNSSKYGNLNSGVSKSRPVDNEKISSILNNVSTSNLSASKGVFTEGAFGNFEKDAALINGIEEWYSRALDVVGLNFNDPLQAYGTFFNKNMQTIGLDPQRPGTSFVFFTRPDLNLSNKSKRGITPFFDYIMTTEIGNFVAEYLQYPNVEDSRVVLDKKYKTTSPFIPLYTNLCKEVSGLKDIVLDSYETAGDFMGHQLSYATGADGYDSIGEVTISYADTLLSPIFLSHYLHIQYIHEVARGEYWPRYKYLARRILDYTISIYIFKLAEDNRTILRWGKLTGCYPVNIPLNTLNHSNEIKVDEMDDISITYKYNFYEPMNPRVFQDFNKLTYPLAFVSGNSDMFDIDKNTNFGSLQLKDTSHPERLLELYGEELTRNENVWGSVPLVIGSKLVFV